MQSFKTFLTEQKNTHMTHIEDLVLDGGVAGTRQAINALQSLRDMLAGHSSNSAKVGLTVKWDGAPAVFAGVDPTDGKFFVAKKGIFNKNPKVYKSHADIEADTFFPELDLNIWNLENIKEFPKDEKNKYDFTICSYTKNI